ncbi:1-acyl-sn-glycerol-3-phosphate acyltransferase 3-like protein [Drosera capensis]
MAFEVPAVLVILPVGLIFLLSGLIVNLFQAILYVLVHPLSKACSEGKENALFISNHRSDIDWLVGWVMAQRSGCLGSTVAILKKALKYLP